MAGELVTADDPGASPDADLLRPVSAVADRAEAAGDHVAAEFLRDHLADLAAPDRPTARIVVVGEKKRGKSSLLNALLAAPGILPVAADIATGTHIAVRYGPAPAARVHSDGGPRGGRDIAVEELAAYASVDPDTLAPRYPDVGGIELFLPHPLLARGVELVDTPGVGGLVADHVSVTTAALAQADALVFVVNGSSELTASECRFLAAATDRVETVLFVLTQTDKYPGWQNVLDRDRELVSRHAPRLARAPWFPVSSTRYLNAVQGLAPDVLTTLRSGEMPASGVLPPLAQRNIDRSGVLELTRAIRVHVADRITTVRTDNLLRSALTVVERHIERAERERSAYRHDPQIVARIREHRGRIDGLLESDAPWRTALSEEFGALRERLERDRHRMTAELRSALERRIATAKPGDFAALEAEITDAARSMWLEMENRLRDETASLVARLTEWLDGHAAEVLPEYGPFPNSAAGLPQASRSGAVPAPGGLAAGGHQIGQLFSEMTAQLMQGKILAASLKFASILTGGLLDRWANRSARAHTEVLRDQDDLRRHMDDVARRVEATLPYDLKDAVADLQMSVTTATGELLARRRSELIDELARYQAVLNTPEPELQARMAAVEATRDDLLRLGAELRGARAGLQAARPDRSANLPPIGR